MDQIKLICIFGLGYIGLPTAAIFADTGVDVWGVEVNDSIIEAIKDGRSHFGEPNLDALVRRVVESGKLRASSVPESADAYIIAVPTPFRHDAAGGGEPDISYVRTAAQMMAPVLAKGNLIILESTCPIGTTERLSHWLSELRPDLTFPHQKGDNSDIRIAYCPERVLPGRILEEVVNNARIIGGMTRKCAQVAAGLYKMVVKGDCRVTNARTAELAKLAENAYRDVNIAFANELAAICDKQRINVWDMISLANLHPRVNILSPGPGVGGHCIAVDPWFIVAGNPEDARLIRAARLINDSRPGQIVEKIKNKAATLLKPVIACLGLTYKKDVDDLRESPALEIVKGIAEARVGEILVVEPHIAAVPPSLAEYGIELADFDDAIERANLVVLLVDHMSFSYVDRDIIKDKFLIDTRGAW